MALRCIFCVLLSSLFMMLFIQLGIGQTPLPVPTEEVQPDSPSTAPSAPPSAAPTGKKKVIYKEKSYYDFEDTLINGNLRKPDGSFIFRKDQSTFSSALNLKRSFIPELKESSMQTR